MEQQRQAVPPLLPRALDVQRFAGAREQEIRALVSALQGSGLGTKFGVAALPRHLRRRAGSHKPYHGHRLRPNAKLQGKRRKLNPAAEDGEAAGSDQAAAADAQHAARPFTNRRMRRQPALLQQQHRESAAWSEASFAAPAADDAADGSGSGSSSSKARRLETHVWHAKRLAMEERYGWLLPAGAAGQGRGSRSLVHVAQASALMHDASYLCPLLLRGARDGVHTALAALLDPAAAAALAADWLDAASGGASSGCYGWEREVMLHHPGQYPRGALCPAQLLLLPSSGGSLGSTSSGAAMEVDAEDGASGASHVQACLWVHPAAAAEAHAALRQAAAGPQVCLEVPNVRRLELRGGAADTALAVALAGATASGIASSSGSGGGRGTVRKQQQQKRAAAAQQHQHEQQQQEALPPPPLPPALAGMGHGDAVQLQLPDPRLCKPVALGSAAGSLLEAAGAAAGSSSLDEPQPLDVGRLLQAPLPLTESELSSRRQQLRRSMLQLETAPGSSSTAADGQQQGQQQAERQAREVQRRGYCPALLVRHEPRERRAAPGWSLILPAGWVPPFWLAAAYAGCKPAGQREWRWLHTLAGSRCFPWDYPDTAAYAALMCQQQLSRLAAAARRPKAKQQLAAPPPPPDWGQLLAHGSSSGQDGAPAARQSQQQQPQAQQREQREAAAMEADAPAVASAAGRSQGWFVARSYASMAAALQGSAAASPGSSSVAAAEPESLPGGVRPVAAALRQGLVAWRPRQQQPSGAAGGPAATGGRCLLEVSVQPIKTGAVAEGAALCFIAGREAERLRTPVDVLSAKQQRRRAREAAEAHAALAAAGGDPAEVAAAAAAAASGSSSGRAEVGEEQVHVFGYVTSEAPRGAPRRCGSLAAVAAPAAWRLRSLQHWAPRQDGGAIEALVRNPGSATLFPARLQLLAEQPQPA